MKAADVSTEPNAPFGDAPRRNGVVHTRMQNFGLTMVVMGGSFALYYLGLFGGVPGPLEPDRIGQQLSALGFSDRHLLFVFLFLMVLAMTWNWIYNAFNRLLGRNLTCAHIEAETHALCGKPAQKNDSPSRSHGYVCSAGHRCLTAEVKVVKKGTVSHFLWMMWLIFSAMVFYLIQQ
jgi:hypothetical protein